ncbi:MAG TPA: nitroreductase family deazaflavin-dependent oxidoreductase [Pseudonocardiaceae bacterium]
MRVVRFFLKTLMVLVAAYAGVIAMGVTVVQLIRHDRKLLRYFKSYNKWIIKIAGKPGVPYALLQHVGRNSGKSYQTPLGAAPLDDGILFALAYGPKTDWLRNVMAAGSCTVHWQGHEYVTERPELIQGAKAVNAWPLLLRPLLWMDPTMQYVWLHKRDAAATKEITPHAAAGE